LKSLSSLIDVCAQTTGAHFDETQAECLCEEGKSFWISEGKGECLQLKSNQNFSDPAFDFVSQSKGKIGSISFHTQADTAEHVFTLMQWRWHAEVTEKGFNSYPLRVTVADSPQIQIGLLKSPDKVDPMRYVGDHLLYEPNVVAVLSALGVGRWNNPDLPEEIQNEFIHLANQRPKRRPLSGIQQAIVQAYQEFRSHPWWYLALENSNNPLKTGCSELCELKEEKLFSVQGRKYRIQATKSYLAGAPQHRYFELTEAESGLLLAVVNLNHSDTVSTVGIPTKKSWVVYDRLWNVIAGKEEGV
jgi:hypothetical protein